MNRSQIGPFLRENAPFFGGPAFEAPDLADDDLLDGDTVEKPWERCVS